MLRSVRPSIRPSVCLSVSRYRWLATVARSTAPLKTAVGGGYLVNNEQHCM